jgi:hypothetical protein
MNRAISAVALFVAVLIVVCVAYFGALEEGRAQVPPTIVQELNGYPPSFVLYWQVGTPPPACNVTQANGSPGPPLYSLAIRQGPPDTVMVCLNGTGGMPVWVPMVTAP